MEKWAREGRSRPMDIKKIRGVRITPDFPGILCHSAPDLIAALIA